ncbi:hypothetical protein ABIA24_004419 [Sinorhizobium fredii]
MAKKSQEPTSLVVREPQLGSHVYQVGKRFRFHLAHDLTAVCLHGDLADTEFEADLLVLRAAVQKPATVAAGLFRRYRGLFLLRR